MTDRITRRDFLRDSAVAAAAIAAGMKAGPVVRAAQSDADKAKQAEEIRKTRSYNENMEYRRLGKTGLWVSAVCLGGHWKRIDKVTDKKDKEAFDKNRAEVVGRCLDVGINYIDACCGAEVRAYTKAVKGKRDKVFMGFSRCETESRMPEWRKAEKLMQSLEEGLKEAGLDYADVWRITMHEKGEKHTDEEVQEAVKALEKAKKDGKVRFTGLSTHNREWLKAQIEKYPDHLQVVLTPYTADSYELPTDSLFETIRKCEVGLFGIKPFASNSLFKGDGSPDNPNVKEDDERARLAIRHILANSAITAPIPGLISIHQVDNMALAVKERREKDGKLDAKEKAKLKAAVAEMWANLPPDYEWLRDYRYV
jgi:aryl-alcohol dehydrogenase-like predicted oxidoreductase